MKNSFRLKSDAMFVRSEEENQIPPMRIVFLSVEGNKTEQNYFEWIEKYREELGIKAMVHVHPLKRAKNDTLSAPQDVLELLEEYIELREADILPERMRKVIPEEYTDEFIKRYMENDESLNRALKENFETLLQQAGIDLEYDWFLKEYSGKKDIFGIVIDRDYDTHSVLQMKNIVQQCKERNYRCFITTPCIEFWLLMHLVDIHSEYKEMQEFRDNQKKSRKHTFTSLQVSNRAGHSKGISEDTFKTFYLPRVDFAIRQAKESFATEIDKLIGTDESEDAKKGELGSNLPELFALLREM